MFYVQTRTYKARVGPVAKSKTETCEHCHKRHEVLVHAWGEGTSVAVYDFSGGRLKNQEAAFEAASRNANALADQALRTTTCPACGRVPSSLQQEVDEAQRAYGRRLRLATFVPLVCGAVAFLPLGLPSFRALAYSAWPLGSALAMGGAVFALVLAVLLWPRKHPLRATAAHLFYRPMPAESAYRGEGPEEPFVPWPSAEKREGFGSLARGATALAFATALLGVALFGLKAGKTHYESLHIVSMAPPGTKIRVSQPGLSDQVIEVRSTSGDAFHAVARVLSLSSPHPLTVTEEGLTPYTVSLTLPALRRQSGTVVLTLRAAAAGKCLALEKPEEGLAPQRASEHIHPDLVFAESYSYTWLTPPSSSRYSSAYRLLPCAEARAREVSIASLAEPGTKLVVAQPGRDDQVFTVGNRAGSDAYLVHARVYSSENGRFSVREGEDDEQSFSLPSDPPKRNAYESKPTWLIVAGASARHKCVGIFTTRYGNSPMGMDAFLGGPPIRRVSPTLTDLWSVEHVDAWFTDTPKTVTASRYQMPTRTSVRIKDCAFFDVVARMGSAKTHDTPTASDDADDADDVPPKPSASGSAKVRVPLPTPKRP